VQYRNFRDPESKGTRARKPKGGKAKRAPTNLKGGAAAPNLPLVTEKKEATVGMPYVKSIVVPKKKIAGGGEVARGRTRGGCATRGKTHPELRRKKEKKTHGLPKEGVSMQPIIARKESARGKKKKPIRRERKAGAIPLPGDVYVSSAGRPGPRWKEGQGKSWAR